NPFDPGIGFDYVAEPEIAPSSGLRFSIQKLYSRPADRFELALACYEARETSAGLEMGLHYDSDSLEPGFVGRIPAYYRTLLRDAIDRPDGLVDELAILDRLRRWQILVEFNETSTRAVGDFAHELFARQAANSPQACAVRSVSEALSYRQL